MSSAKTILVTGGGRGLGRGVVETLAKRGHRVIFTVRDAAQGHRVLEEVRAASPSASVEVREMDLASLASVRRLGSALASEPTPIDVLFHVAGVLQQSRTRRTTQDGLEETIAVNTLAPFLLTYLALPALARSPAARVVCVSSRLHLPGSRGPEVRFDFDDPCLERDYDPDRAYKNSKLALMWLTYELARRLADRRICANAVCPGFVPETAADSVQGFQRWLLRNVLVHMPFAVRYRDAVDNLAFVADDPSIEGKTGLFFAERKPSPSSPESYDETKARRFWTWASSVTGVSGEL